MPDITQNNDKPKKDKLKAFIAYAPPKVPEGENPDLYQEKNLRHELEKSIKLVEHIETWHEGHVLGGSVVSQAVDKHFDEADLILLLINSDFLASDHCYDNLLMRAMQRHKEGKARVIPILLEACFWDNAPFAKFQFLPRDGKPIIRSGKDKALTNERFAEVARELQKTVCAILKLPLPGKGKPEPEQKPKTEPSPPLPDKPKTGIEKKQKNLRGEKVYLLCNRGGQSKAFRAQLETPGKKPLVCLLYGLDEEQHQSFVLRLVEEMIKPKFGEEEGGVKLTTPTKEIGRLQSLESGLQCLKRELKLVILKSLNDAVGSISDGEGLEFSDLAKLYRNHDAIVLQHNFYASDWTKLHQKVLQKYLTDFWGKGLDTGRTQFFVFINMVMDEKAGFFSKLLGRSRTNNIVADLNAIQKAVGDNCLLLDELQAINLKHVSDWFSTEVHAWDFDPEYDKATVMQKLFAKTDQAHMQQVETELKKAIKEAKPYKW